MIYYETFERLEEILEMYVDDVCDDIATGNGLSDRDILLEVYGMVRYAYCVGIISKNERQSFFYRLRDALNMCDNQ